jgi:predicted ArsR family transcriptional regulator
MKNTRQRIIDYIKSRNLATVLEISQALNITPANARYHVQSMLKQGVLEKIGICSDQIARRPPGVYSLTSSTRRHNMDRLVASLLIYSLQNKTPSKQLEILEKITFIMCGNSTHSTETVSQKLYETINLLNEMNYSAHWEAHATMPRIIFNHCPYKSILNEHPELCYFDQILLHTLTGLSFSQKSRLEKDKHGSSYCLFLTSQQTPG